jgi:hypothetical protein
MSAPFLEAPVGLIASRSIHTFTAGEDLLPGYVVEFTADWTVKKTTSATASSKVAGITLTKAASGTKVSVIAIGVCKAALAYGTITAGDQVASAPGGAVQTYTTKDTCAIGTAIAGTTSGGTAIIFLW